MVRHVERLTGEQVPAPLLSVIGYEPEGDNHAKQKRIFDE